MRFKSFIIVTNSFRQKTFFEKLSPFLICWFSAPTFVNLLNGYYTFKTRLY